MRYFFLLISAVYCTLLISCNDTATTNPEKTAGKATAVPDDTATINGHPAWIDQGNIYEVNIRQYTPEATCLAT